MSCIRDCDTPCRCDFKRVELEKVNEHCSKVIKEIKEEGVFINDHECVEADRVREIFKPFDIPFGARKTGEFSTFYQSLLQPS